MIAIINRFAPRNSVHVISVVVFSAEVGRNVMLTSGCIMGACCQVNTCEVIPENTVIYGSECLRRVQTERPQVMCVSAIKINDINQTFLTVHFFI